jgi:hypothetical protein
MKQAGGNGETVPKADDVEIHTAKMEELPYIMEIFEYAKKFMADTGNPHQWGDTYPAVDDIVKGVENGDILLSNNIQKGNYKWKDPGGLCSDYRKNHWI